MWILPSTISRCAPVPEDSILASDWRFQALAASVTLSGKPTQSKSCYRAWRTKGWMRRLCGRILEPSTAARGAESWMESLRASRASLTASPGSGLGRVMSETYGRSRLESLARLNPHGCFSKTLEEAPDFFAAQSGRNWSEWVTGLRRDCSRRQKLGRATSGSGYSCWPTTQASDRPGRGRHGYAMNGKGGMDISSAAENWDTPKASHADKGGPNMRDSSPGSRPNEKGGKMLSEEAKNWPTPKSRDVKGESQRGEHGPMDALPNMACHFSPPGPATGDGARSSSDGPGSRRRSASKKSERPPRLLARRLNPMFVENLMGWPTDWTACGSPATGLSAYRQRLHSSFWLLICLRAERGEG